MNVITTTTTTTTTIITTTTTASIITSIDYCYRDCYYYYYCQVDAAGAVGAGPGGRPDERRPRRRLTITMTNI